MTDEDVFRFAGESFRKIPKRLEEWIKQKVVDKQKWKHKHSQQKYSDVEISDSVNIEEFYKHKNYERITIERPKGNDHYLIEYQLRINLEKQRRKFRPMD